VAYALKLGQVGPLLLLLFAIGWRWRDRPGPLGVAGALGAIVKIQPGIILAWALLTGRWRAAAIGAIVGVLSALVATLVIGRLSIWPDYLVLLRHVSDPITTPHNFTMGAVAFQMGISESAATALQLGTSGVVLVAVVYAALRMPAEASYVVAVIASQLLSPILWDHYAMLLLLPVAFLLERGQWWSLVIPLATSVLILPFGIPPIVYPIAFGIALVGVLVFGRRPTPMREADGGTRSVRIPSGAPVPGG
jgi:alpha-1,2-mannosyltransferase